MILVGDDYRLAPAYDLLHTALHINDTDFGLDEGLSREIEKSEVWERTGHPSRLDFERFGIKIGLVKKRIDQILNKYSLFPVMTNHLLYRSYLPEKAIRSYVRIVKERINRFNRVSQ